MKLIVGCEESQVITIAFRKLGHEAYSCDVQNCSGGHPEWHIKDDVLKHLNDGWDMGIFHPPCTFLSVSGYHWNYRRPERMKKTEQAIEFFMEFANCDIPKFAIENPVSIMSTRWRKPDQIIQPYQFGHDASKQTCLWLKGLPPLVPTRYIEPRMVGNKPRWSNQTDGGQNKLPPSPTRGKERSKTYEGIANAMAEQWSDVSIEIQQPLFEFTN